MVIDLARLSELPAEQGGPLARYTAAIGAQRGDFNRRVLTIRAQDLQSLAVIYDMSPETLTEQLSSWGVISTDVGGPGPL